SVGGPIMDAERLGRVEAAVAAGDYEEALRLHLESPIGGLSPAEADAFATNPMTRPPYADIVVQAPSIAPALHGCTTLASPAPYPAVTVPTLLLLGGASGDPFVASATALLEAIPHAELATLEGQTHMATLFAPHLVADALRRFLTGSGAGAC